MVEEVPLFEIAWDVDDITNVVESVGRGGYWAKGPFVDQFEADLETYLDREHAVVFNSGTTAIVGALEALGVGPGDEVVVPSFTFIATANAVKLAGGDPVFADIERETYGLDPDAVAEAVTDDTVGILPIHCYGSSCDLDGLQAVADEHDLFLLEDAAEALGATYDGDLVGTQGDAAALSFCQNKIVATGEGGAVVTDDDETAERLRRWRSHGRVAHGDYFQSAETGEYVSLGTNTRMADIVAALGCSQLAKIEDLVAGRRAAAGRLNEAIGAMDGVEPHLGYPDERHVYQLYTVTLAPEVDRQGVIDRLAEAGVASKVYWDPPAHRTRYYAEELGVTVDLSVTEDVASRVLSLPIHPNLSRDETDHVVAALEAALAEAR